MKNNFLKYIICIIFLSIAIFSIYKILSTLNEYKDGEDTYNELKQYTNIKSNETLSNDIIWPEVDFNSLKEINNDIIGWIYFEDTNINYPIVKGSDNDFYLNHMIDGTNNSAGSIFMDYRNQANFNNKHTIIYGHHMKNGSMFSNLIKYKEQSFYDEYPYYLIMTPDKNYKIDIISGYVASVNEDSWKLNFSSNKEYEKWLKKTIDASLFKSNIIPNTKDNIITLSTCSYEFDNARFVLVGIISNENI